MNVIPVHKELWFEIAVRSPNTEECDYDCYPVVAIEQNIDDFNESSYEMLVIAENQIQSISSVIKDCKSYGTCLWQITYARESARTYLEYQVEKALDIRERKAKAALDNC